MEFKTHNDGVEFESSCLQGYIDISYAELKAKLGQPDDGDGHKTDAEWEIKFEDGTYATIYNYKDGKAYNGSSGTPKSKIRDWHIGGMSPKSVERVKALFK